MSTEVAAAVLAKASALDANMPTPNRVTLQAWAEQMAGIKLREAVEAVRQHYRTSKDRIMPADVIELVRAARQDEAMRAAAALPAVSDPDAAARHRQIVRSILGAPSEEAQEHAKALGVACPWCGAAVGSPCSNGKRRARNPHPSRLAQSRRASA